MSLTVLMTINDRPAKVMDAVFSSFSMFPGNGHYDEMVIVNDRGDHTAIQSALDRARLLARIVDIDGEPGRGPQGVAWNVGFRNVSTTHVYAISSDCIQLPWSVQTGEWFSRKFPDVAVVARAEHCGRMYDWRVMCCQHDEPVEVMRSKTMNDSYSGRPEGFAWVLPMAMINALDPPGYDERFTGNCYDDSDLLVRIVQAGTNLILCDDMCAVHMEHAKPYLDDTAKTEYNRVIFAEKHGTDELAVAIRREHLALARISHCISVLCKDPSVAYPIAEEMGKNYPELS